MESMDSQRLTPESEPDAITNNSHWKCPQRPVYERDGDYYIPCLKLPETHIGVWGERYLTYIREHKKLLHNKLMVNGTLYDHLAEINSQAEEMFSELVKQLS